MKGVQATTDVETVVSTLDHSDTISAAVLRVRMLS